MEPLLFVQTAMTTSPTELRICGKKDGVHISLEGMGNGGNARVFLANKLNERGNAHVFLANKHKHIGNAHVFLPQTE